MQDEDISIQLQKKKEILIALGRLVHQNRTNLNKGINTFSYEYDIGNGLLSRLEKGGVDTKITTLWKLANAFGYKCSDFVKLVEENLPEDFSFYN
ncbi:MAG: hypothetical protein NC191_01830 [Muribaculaceae bacterium]|nr:hypothetical protein [Muribaculaceae bacterium]